MASTQVVVRVLDGRSVVDESIRRPVRLTPDGFAGVVYAGAVFPLQFGNVIDVSGPSWELEDCNRFLFADAEIPYASNEIDAVPASRLPGFNGLDGPWNVESNKFGHYVVFNASERVAGDVVAALELAELSVQRWDVSHRRASDGRFYDWFARLRFKGSHDECVARVDAVLSTRPAETSLEPGLQEPAVRRLEELEAQVELLLDQVVQLRARLASAEGQSADLRVRLERTSSRDAQLTDDLDRAIARQRALHEQIDVLRESAQLAPDTDALLAQQSETEELLEMALADNAGLRQEVASLTDRSDQGESRRRNLETTLADLSQRLEELGEQERERRRAAGVRLGPPMGVAGFLGRAFARLEFVLDSVEVLANLETHASALRVLVRIDMGESLGKDLEGFRGWREVSKVSTGIAGSEDMGRIYYKPDGDRVLVCVHVKRDDKEQRRHIERLRSV